MRLLITGILCLLVSLPLCLRAQRVDSSEISPALSSKYIHSIAVRSESINAKVDQHTANYLNRLKEQEQTLQRKLNKIDSNAATWIFNGSAQQYEKLQTGLKNNSENLLKSYGKYLPGIDSAVTSLKFLQQGALANPKLAGQLSQINAAFASVKQLDGKPIISTMTWKCSAR